MPHAQEVVKKLTEQYDVYIATAAMDVPTSFHDKYEWLLEFFPFCIHSNLSSVVVKCSENRLLNR